MEKDPDIELMLRFQAGDPGAFRDLFAKHQKRIINFCYRFCKTPEAAEEMAQEVFLRVYKAAPRYKPGARFSTWLFRIATNVCLNAARADKYRRLTRSLDEPTRRQDGTAVYPDIADPAPLQQSVLETREEAALIEQALESLPQKQRAALILRANYGFSYADISGQIGCSESAVKNWIHRGRKRLKALLKPTFGENR